MTWPDRGDRQAIAGVAVVGLAAVVPIVVGIALIAATAWLITMKTIGVINGPADIHATVFGWLTDWSYTKDGHRVATPNTLPLAWFIGWINVYVVYQLAEVTSMLVQGFARLARREPKVLDE